MKDTSLPQGELMRKELEAAGIYKHLVDLHERNHIGNCFCTTEIAPSYGAILAIISDYSFKLSQIKVKRAEIEKLKEVKQWFIELKPDGLKVFMNPNEALNYPIGRIESRIAWCEGQIESKEAQLTQSTLEEEKIIPEWSKGEFEPVDNLDIDREVK